MDSKTFIALVDFLQKKDPSITLPEEGLDVDMKVKDVPEAFLEKNKDRLYFKYVYPSGSPDGYPRLTVDVIEVLKSYPPIQNSYLTKKGLSAVPGKKFTNLGKAVEFASQFAPGDRAQKSLDMVTELFYEARDTFLGGTNWDEIDVIFETPAGESTGMTIAAQSFLHGESVEFAIRLVEHLPSLIVFVYCFGESQNPYMFNTHGYRRNEEEIIRELVRHIIAAKGLSFLPESLKEAHWFPDYLGKGGW